MVFTLYANFDQTAGLTLFDDPCLFFEHKSLRLEVYWMLPKSRNQYQFHPTAHKNNFPSIFVVPQNFNSLA